MQYEMFREETELFPKDAKTKRCSSCKKHLPANEIFFHVNTHNSGKRALKNFCRACDRRAHVVVNTLRKTAPPIPSNCECCDRPFKELESKKLIHLDHCKDTETFRGWLCKNCNIALGLLGDTPEGVEKALAYLKRWEVRIGIREKE